MFASAYSSSHASKRGGGVCGLERRRRFFCFFFPRQCLATAWRFCFCGFWKGHHAVPASISAARLMILNGADLIDAVCVLWVEWFSTVCLLR